MHEGQKVIAEISAMQGITGVIGFTRTALPAVAARIIPSVVLAYEDYKDMEMDEALWVLPGKSIEPGEQTSTSN